MTTLDEVARQLVEWRVAAGSPSYSELARAVAARRAGTGDPRQRAPGRVTVYDCFREGRSRIDVALAVDLAAVLGVGGEELARWRARCGDAMRPGGTAPRAAAPPDPAASPAGTVTASGVAPAPVLPGITTEVDEFPGTRLLIAAMAGSGKTQAAARLLDRLRREGRIERVLTLRVDGPGADVTELLAAAGQELGVRLPDAPGPGARQLLELLARTRSALLLDDVAAPEQVAELVAVDSTVPLLVTSRRALTVAGLPRIDLPPWTPQQSETYLRAVVGGRRTDAEPAATRDLAELTGGLPLVAALVAARVRDSPGWSLTDHAAALRERRSGDRLDDAVGASMDATRAALSPRAREVLALLAAGPRAGLRAATLEASAGTEIGGALDELRRAFLLLPGDERHQLHDTARRHARSRARDEDPPSVRTEREDRIIDRLCAEAWGVAFSFSPGDLAASRFDHPRVAVPAPQAWLAADLPGALEMSRAARERRPEATIKLSEAMALSLERSGLHRLAAQLHASARAAAVATGDPVGEARAGWALAVTAMRRGEPVEQLEEITALASRTGDSWTLARLRILRGILAMRAGSDAEGRGHFEAAHALAVEAGLDALEPVAAGNLAICRAYDGDLAGALEWNAAALAAAERTGNAGLAASTLSNMSETQRLLGRHDEAVASARRAVARARAAGDRMGTAHALIELGASRTATGRPGDAVAALELAESIATGIGHVTLAATLHTRIGEALVATGDAPGATARFRAALAAPNDGPIDPATALHQLGRLTRDPAERRRLYERSLGLLGDGYEPVAAAVRADLAALGAVGS